MSTIHTNANSLETAKIATNYPYGSLKYTMHFFVEHKPKKGWRAVTQSINPKNGKLNKPHAGTYSLLPIVIEEKENNFFEFVHCPHPYYPDKMQAFLDTYFSALSDSDKKYVKTAITTTEMLYPNQAKMVFPNE